MQVLKDSLFIFVLFSGLSGHLSIFFETLKTMSDDNKADVPSDDFQIQTFDVAQQDELISVAESDLDASRANIQQDYLDLSSKYQMVLKMLEDEQKQFARNQQEHENRKRLLEEQLETLRQQLNEFTTDSNSTADTDGKLAILKVRFNYSSYQRFFYAKRWSENGHGFQLKSELGNRLYLGLGLVLRRRAV